MTESTFPGDPYQEDARGDAVADREAGDGGPLAFGAGVEEASSGRKKRTTKKRSSKPRRSKARRAPAKDSGDGGDTGDSDDGRGADAPKRRPRRKRKSSADSEAETQAPETRATEAPAENKKKRPRRRKSSASKESAEAEAPEARRDASDDSDDSKAPARRRRRGSRGGRRRKTKGAAEVESIPGEEDDLPLIPELPEDAERIDDEGGSKKKRKRSRSSKKKTGAKTGAKDESKEREKPARKKAKRSRREERADTEVEEKSVARNQLICVNAVDREEKRVAVVEDGRIVDFLMTAESQKTLVSDIYRGKVVNLEPAIGAAFVDFGQGRNGFLHTSDVLSVYGEDGFTLERLLTTSVDPEELEPGQASIDEIDDSDDEEAPEKKTKAKKKSSRRRMRQRLPITDLIKVGSQVVVQVTKDAIGDKGPTLTTYISIPGRYLVLMPSMTRTGVSRKIDDEKERRRLKRILQSLKIPDDMGVIVRTAGIGKTKTELRRDLDYLLGLWENFGKRLRKGRGPMPLYQESDVAIRTLRDLFNENTEAVIVDDPMVHDQLMDFANQLMPEQIERIKLHDGQRPLYHHYGVEQEFEKIFARRVELPSGGSVVFDQTEALVAIDVNSGRTRTDGFDFEEIALKTNLDAVPEIALQIRLRDLGGIIVCDFIDMMRTSSMRQVERALRGLLAKDRARSKLGRISQFGLLELTRQRLGPGTHKKVFQACPRCRGTGHIRSVPSRAAAILRRLGSALTQKGFSTVELRAHPEVVDYMKEDLFDYVRALEHRFEKEILLVQAPDQPEDSVLRYLRADGREVRPGGRRRR